MRALTPRGRLAVLLLAAALAAVIGLSLSGGPALAVGGQHHDLADSLPGV